MTERLEAALQYCRWTKRQNMGKSTDMFKDECGIRNVDLEMMYWVNRSGDVAGTIFALMALHEK